MNTFALYEIEQGAARASRLVRKRCVNGQCICNRAHARYAWEGVVCMSASTSLNGVQGDANSRDRSSACMFLSEVPFLTLHVQWQTIRKRCSRRTRTLEDELLSPLQACVFRQPQWGEPRNGRTGRVARINARRAPGAGLSHTTALTAR